MEFRFAHNNFNVRDLDKSLAFYKEALGLEETRRKEAADGSFFYRFRGIVRINRVEIWSLSAFNMALCSLAMAAAMGRPRPKPLCSPLEASAR